MAFKKKKVDDLIRIKVIFEDGSFELLRVTLEEFRVLSADFYQPKAYYKEGKGYPFPEDESEWDKLKGSFICLEP